MFYFQIFAIVSIISSSFLFGSGAISPTGGILTLELHYSNPANVDNYGSKCDSPSTNICDPFFEICVSDATPGKNDCQMYWTRTKTYSGSSIVELTGANSFKIYLLAPTLTNFYLTVRVFDADILWSSTLIGIFQAKSVALKADGVLRHAPMRRWIFGGTKDSALELTVKYKFQCRMPFGGPYCDVNCDDPDRTYDCSEKGAITCHTAYVGERCEHQDPCLVKPCASIAECKHTVDGSDRTCHCYGGTGPECYSNVDPCLEVPCKNNATCTPTGTGEFNCKCQSGFTGFNCDIESIPVSNTGNQIVVIGSIIGLVFLLIIALALCCYWRGKLFKMKGKHKVNAWHRREPMVCAAPMETKNDFYMDLADMSNLSNDDGDIPNSQANDYLPLPNTIGQNGTVVNMGNSTCDIYEAMAGSEPEEYPPSICSRKLVETQGLNISHGDLYEKL